MSPVRVGIVGATGQTGSSIVSGLLEAGDLSITALTRPASIDKPKVQALKDRGVKVIPADLTGPEDALVESLKDIDVLVSAVSAQEQAAQIPLAIAAKKAGVKRFVPCAFITVAPPNGVMDLRDWKEDIYNHIKKINLPYTIIDVGWWYQISLPEPKYAPEKFKYYMSPGMMAILVGDGNTPTAITDLRDIGKHVARIIADERTLNKYVLAYNEVWTPNQIYDKIEQVTGEKLQREHVSGEELTQRIKDAREILKTDPTNFKALFKLIPSQYQYSWGIRGDNTPEYAKYLGYLTTKELYPDAKLTPFETFLHDVVEKRVSKVYEDDAAIKAAFE